MYGDKAKLSINKRPYVPLAVGEEDKSGVKVLSVSKEAVVLRHQGTNYRFKRRSRTGEALPRVVTIERGPNNMFWTRGTIEGVSVGVVVDTGASHVVISADRARKLGLRYNQRQPVRMTTASRTEIAYEVTLSSVGIGGIFKNQVGALVTRGKFPSTVLLGMSFLGSLQIRQEQDRLVITD
jgi:aspartyl protease family protein